ncbi:MAG TPA: diaminopimelate epimerase [Bacteroidia bacterium]|nr:diaminopimelate epimerase [Bacteroidia bacterium]HNP98102.1 diaminopimelate epimerase [Bacteroidia bacterium]
MRLHFEKYHGTGNDFIIIDDRARNFNLTREQIEKLCHRRFGIGADGLLLLRESDGLDFEMIYYNSDGLPGSMCGNGGRCIVAFAYRLGIVQTKIRFLAADGIHEASILSTDPMQVLLQMGDVNQIETNSEFQFLNTGSPHVVKKVLSVDSVNVLEEGRKIRYNDRFKVNGTNVNFIEVRGNELFVRTYERGVEDETLSCGTGVTASALAANIARLLPSDSNPTIVKTPGGTLKVHFTASGSGYSNIFLEGPASHVFTGSFEVPFLD